MSFSKNLWCYYYILVQDFRCCIFWPAFDCCALQMMVKFCFFLKHFWGKKLKKLKRGRKSKKFDAQFSKKLFFISLPQDAGLVFYSQKKTLSLLKHVFTYKKVQNVAIWRCYLICTKIFSSSLIYSLFLNVCGIKWPLFIQYTLLCWFIDTTKFTITHIFIIFIKSVNYINQNSSIFSIK